MRRADLITGLVAAAVGAYALQLAFDLGMYGAHRVPGPGFFPRLLSSLLLGLGLLLAVRSLRRRPVTVQPGTAEGAETTGGYRDEVRRQLRAGSVWLCLVLSVPLLALLGFVPSMALLVFVLLFAVEGRRDWRAVLTAIVIPVACSALFVDLLTIPLPTGLLSHGPLGI
jgi:putative tricarboxylic transport membrane protein